MGTNEATEVKLYHYTSKEGMEGIKSEGKITASETGIDGKGVYLTSMDPSHSSVDKVLFNNYDDQLKYVKQQHEHKVQCVVEVTMPKDEVTKVERADSRDVYKSKDDVVLAKYKHRIVENKK